MSKVKSAITGSLFALPFIILNFKVMSIILIVIFIPIFTALVGEMYRCEILKIPNCD